MVESEDAGGAKIFQTPMVKEDAYSQYPIDILIPFHGQYQRVYQLCQGIWRSLGSRFNYQICLIDDHSPNTHFINGFAKAPKTMCIRNKSQLGFGGALEAGFLQTKAPWMVIMHSDTVPETPLWLGQLIDSFNALQPQKVAMVSARTDNPGEGYNTLLKGSKNQPTQDVILREGVLPLYCAFCPRTLFKRIGGFIKAYPFAWYESEELAARMKKCGYTQGISGNSWIRHIGEATLMEVWKTNPKAKGIMESNHDRCVADIGRLGKI